MPHVTHATTETHDPWTAVLEHANGYEGLRKLVTKAFYSLRDIENLEQIKEDLVQDALLTVLSKADHWDQDMPLGPWVVAVSKNSMIRNIAKYRTTDNSVDCMAHEPSDDDPGFFQALDSIQVREVFDRSSAQERAAMMRLMNRASLSRQEYRTLARVREREQNR